MEITISNMNDNVDENFLRNLLQKCGPIEEQTIYRHPRTQRRLGIARIVFIDVKSARACIERYNQQSVMGNVMNVFHDAFGEQCKQMLLDANGEKKPPKPIVPPPPPQQQPPIIPTVTQQMPSFKPKDELVPHANESDAFFPVDYNNPYTRSGSHTSNETHKPEDSEWNNSRDKYDEYGYVDEQRHYRYDKKDGRRWDWDRDRERDRERDWDSKSTRYHKSDKDRDRRSDRRDYRSHRDERDRDRRRDYDYERKDRRDRDNRSRDTKYRDYKKSDRDYMTPIDSSFSHSSSNVYPSTSHHHSSHHPPPYPPFESSSTSFHQYPPLP